MKAKLSFIKWSTTCDKNTIREANNIVGVGEIKFKT